ncbi:MAG: transcriptional regulator MntR [Phycisphaerales bacterium]|nr:MAG: transcriptional regulator MntR [Phycisphaerales bacterium]
MTRRRAPNRFERTRLDHATELAEDYTELIAELIDTRGEARVGDIAAALGVSHVAVSRMVGRLLAQGLVDTEPYQPVQLTPEGRAMARRARKRHEIVVAFLISIGVSPAQAETDAEGIEHHCSKETIEAMARAANIQ